MRDKTEYYEGLLESDGFISETDSIICPHCFHEEKDDYDYRSSAPFKKREVSCECCEKDFEVDCEIDVIFDYMTYKKKEEEQA